jgi:hypothetical protein
MQMVSFSKQDVEMTIKYLEAYYDTNMEVLEVQQNQELTEILTKYRVMLDLINKREEERNEK